MLMKDEKDSPPLDDLIALRTCHVVYCLDQYNFDNCQECVDAYNFNDINI